MRRIIPLLFILAACPRFALDAAEPEAPRKSKGLANQIVLEGSSVVLDGSFLIDSKSALPSSVSWLQVSGPAVRLMNPSGVITSFAAPMLTSNTPIPLSFEGKFEDARGKIQTETVTAMVFHKNRPPTAVIGTDFAVKSNDSVYLSGEASVDPDGDILDFLWTQEFGPVVPVSGARAQEIYFLAPGWTSINSSLDRSVRFRLTVTDPYGAASSTSVAVTIWEPTPNEYGWKGITSEEIKKVKALEADRNFYVDAHRKEMIATELSRAQKLMDAKEYAGVTKVCQKVLVIRSDQEDAIKLMRRAEAKIREPFRMEMREAKGSFLNKDYLAALRHLSQAKDVISNDPEETAYREICLSALEQEANAAFTDAVVQYARSVAPRLDIEKSRSLYSQGLLLYAQGKQLEAMESWQKAVAFNSNNRLAITAYNRVVEEIAQR